MEENGLVHKKVYAEVPPRMEYSLTELGQSLQPVLDAMRNWGEDYIKARMPETTLLYTKQGLTTLFRAVSPIIVSRQVCLIPA